eukprot:15437616-Alexandrium_andersonii.AAC.1
MQSPAVPASATRAGRWGPRDCRRGHLALHLRRVLGARTRDSGVLVAVVGAAGLCMCDERLAHVRWRFPCTCKRPNNA